MRKAALSIALLFLAVSAQAEIVYKNFSQPVSFQYFLPCANSGQGELIDFTGTMQTTLAEVLENGWVIAQFHIVPRITATGETTGITYQVVGSETFTAKLNPAKVATGIESNNFSVVGNGLSYHVHENLLP